MNKKFSKKEKVEILQKIVSKSRNLFVEDAEKSENRAADNVLEQLDNL